MKMHNALSFGGGESNQTRNHTLHTLNAPVHKLNVFQKYVIWNWTCFLKNFHRDRAMNDIDSLNDS